MYMFRLAFCGFTSVRRIILLHVHVTWKKNHNLHYLDTLQLFQHVSNARGWGRGAYGGLTSLTDIHVFTSSVFGSWTAEIESPQPT